MVERSRRASTDVDVGEGTTAAAHARAAARAVLMAITSSRVSKRSNDNGGGDTGAVRADRRLPRFEARMFHALRVIGEGRYGRVCLAKQTRPAATGAGDGPRLRDEFVALKVMNKSDVRHGCCCRVAAV